MSWNNLAKSLLVSEMIAFTFVILMNPKPKDFYDAIVLFFIGWFYLSLTFRLLIFDKNGTSKEEINKIRIIEGIETIRVTRFSQYLINNNMLSLEEEQ